MFVLIICLIVLYLLSVAVCTLSTSAIGGREAKIVATLAFVPIINLILTVLVFVILYVMYRESKVATKQKEANKS